MRAAANNKRLIIGVVSLLIVALVYSSFPKSYVAFAAITYGDISCSGEGSLYLVRCCQTQTDDEGIETEWCTWCDNTSPPSNCSPRYQVGHAVAPPSPQTGTCPENTALDAQGNCAPLTQSPEQALTDQAPGLKSPLGTGVITPPPSGVAPPPPTTPVPPVPPPGQEDTDDGRDDLLPDTGITEQPEVQQPEQEPSSEGEGPAGPLT
jgi:hypothetical protein